MLNMLLEVQSLNEVVVLLLHVGRIVSRGLLRLPL